MRSAGAERSDWYDRVTAPGRRALVHGHPGWFFVLNGDGRIVHWSPQLAALIGRSRDEPGGVLLLDTVAPEDRAAAAAAIDQGFAQGRMDAEIRLLGEDGTRLPLFCSAERTLLGGCKLLVGLAVDLREWRRGNDERRRLAEILEATPDFVGVADASMRVSYINPAGRAMLGLGPLEELRGTSIELYHPPWVVKLLKEEAVPHAVRHGSWSGESAVLSRAGEEIPVSQVVLAHLGPGDEIEYLSTILRDMRSRRRVEKELKHRESQLQVLLRQMPAILWTVDRDLRFTTGQGAGLSALGLAPNEAVGTTLYDYFGTADPAMPAIGAHMRALEGEPSEFEFAWRDRAYHVRVEPLRDAAGAVVGAIGAAADVTEITRAQEDLRQVMAAAPDVFYVFDLETKRSVYSNKSAAEVLGFPHEEIREEQLPLGLMHPEDHERLFVHLARMRDQPPDRVDTFEYRMRHKDGSWRWFQSRDVVLRRAPDGRPTQIVGSAVDITERKHAEEQLRRMNEELERRVEARTRELSSANRELEAFSYSVAHDLRGPLRAINGFAFALREDEGDKLGTAGQEHLERILGASRRMGRLIDDLLRLAQVGRADPRRRDVNLSTMAKGVVETLARGEPRPDVDVTIAADVHVQGDQDLLLVAMENLLGNAWKFTRRTHPARIEFGVARRGADPVYFVRDDGAGFDMQYAGSLFRPFHRLHREEEFEGTGVGLAIVDRVIRRHGGRLWAEGSVGAGATFYFTVSPPSDYAVSLMPTQ